MKQHYLSFSYSFVLALLTPFCGFSQQIDTIFGCDEIPSTPVFAAACTICNFEILYGTTFPYTPSVDAGWCGSVENDQYIGFIAGPGGSVSFQMETFGCINGNGVQVGIYDQSNTLIGDCFNQVFPGAPQVFSAAGMIPGNLYYLRIDGFAGDGCEFKIYAIDGLVTQAPDAPGPISGPSKVCWDETYLFSVAPVPNTTTYYWRVTPGIWTLGTTVDPPEAADPAQGTRSTSIDLEIPQMSSGMPPGTCDDILLEVFPMNSCYSSQASSSYTVTVCRPLQDTVTLEVCPGGQVEFPPGSGEFFPLSSNLELVEVGPTPYGCDSFAVLRTIPLVGQYADTLYRTGTYSGCETGYVYPPTGQIFSEGSYVFAAIDSNSSGSCDTAIALTVTRSGDPLPSVLFLGDRVICDSTTSLTSVIQSGVPPFVFEWTTGDRDSATLASVVNNLSPGLYGLMVTDSLGCTLDTSFVIESFQDAIPELRIDPADCFGDGGSASLVGNNTSSFDIVWSTGANTSTITGLSSGQYSVTLSLPNASCIFDTVFTVPVDTLCYSVIEGFVTSYVSFDCAAPQPRFPFENVEVVLNGSRRTFTDHAGYYSFRVDTGTHTVESINPDTSLFTATCTQQHIVSIQSYQAPTTRADFYYIRDSLPDIELIVHATPASVGRSNTLVGRACNYSSIDQLIDVTLTYDSDKQEVIWTRPNTPLVTTNPGLITFEDVVVPAFGCSSLMVGLKTFSSVAVGDTLCYFGTTDSLTIDKDATPDNNRDTVKIDVRASYDPNVKLVSPGGVGEDNIISEQDTLLEYTIIFQNTGSDDALYVRLEDQLLPELNASTFKPIAASHPYVVNLEDDNRLTVIFDDIRLPPMDESFEDSQGFFTFEIERETDLQEGTKITNFADIFFDFNPAIRTPISRLMLPVTEIVIPEVPSDTSRVSAILLLYPNPTRNYLIAQSSTADSVLSVELVSVDGKTFPLPFVGGDATKGNQEFRVDRDRFPSGIYFARVGLLAGRVEFRKVVLE